MEGDDEVGDAKGFRDDEYYGSVDMVTGGVGAVGFVGAYVKEVFRVTFDGGSQRDGEPVEKGAARGGRVVFWRRSGEGAHPRSDERVGECGGKRGGGRAAVVDGGEDRKFDGSA